MEAREVIVVGGGPAGSTCAWRLRQRGIDVLVLNAAMMRPSANPARVYLRCEPMDFRQGMHSPAVPVEQDLGLDPFAQKLYLFTNRRDAAMTSRGGAWRLAGHPEQFPGAQA